MQPVPLKTLRRLAFALVAATLFGAFARDSLVVAQDLRERADVVTSSDGIRIAYEVHGSGPTALVFVHGWSCDRRYWRGQIRPFSQAFKVVAVDLAGHGQSGPGRKAWTMAAFGGDVAAVVKKLGLERVILVGHSMGGDVVVEAARQLPGRVAGLVWVDTYKQLRTSRTPEQFEAFIDPFRTDFVESTRRFVRGMFSPTSDRVLAEKVAMDMSSAPPDVALGSMESALRYDREIPPALGRLKLPVFAINPDYPPTDVESLEKNGVQVLFMPGVGHFPMLEDPARFNPLLQTAAESIGR